MPRLSFCKRSYSTISMKTDNNDHNDNNDNDRNNDNDNDHTTTKKRTQSFTASWAGNLFLPSETQNTLTRIHRNNNPNIKIHTLILGTHPSITSLAKEEYFGHATNAFWWIAGDCLGFCRAIPKSPTTSKQYYFAPDLRHYTDESNNGIISYPEQLQILTNHGFAIWDLIQSCEREGSLDMNIEDEIPNPILEFCLEHTSIRRIVFANGLKQCQMFRNHFKSWWDYYDADGSVSSSSKEEKAKVPFLVPANDELSRKAFGRKYSKRLDHHLEMMKYKSKHDTNNNNNNNNNKRIIECVCMVGVSNANARFTYKDKRAYWETYCYAPALLDHERLNHGTNNEE